MASASVSALSSCYGLPHDRLYHVSKLLSVSVLSAQRRSGPDPSLLQQSKVENTVQAGLVCQLDTGWSYHRERSLPWGNASMRSNREAFSQLVIKVGRSPCGWCHPWAGSLGFYKRAGWASQGKQASKEHPSIDSASAPASWPAWVPVLTSFGDVMTSNVGSVSWINPFLPNLLLCHDVCAGTETLSKTHTIETPAYPWLLWH